MKEKVNEINSDEEKRIEFRKLVELCVAFKEDVNATLYKYNSGDTWGITNADKLNIKFASKNEEEFNSLFN